MKFDWSKFTKENYKKYLDCCLKFDGYVGAVHVGDICIDFVNYPNEQVLGYDFYVLHEDTGYGEKDGVPYDLADGGGIDIPHDLSYEEFKTKTEKLFIKYMDCWTEDLYSLLEHANRPLEIW